MNLPTSSPVDPLTFTTSEQFDLLDDHQLAALAEAHHQRWLRLRLMEEGLDTNLVEPKLSAAASGPAERQLFQLVFELEQMGSGYQMTLQHSVLFESAKDAEMAGRDAIAMGLPVKHTCWQASHRDGWARIVRSKVEIVSLPALSELFRDAEKISAETKRQEEHKKARDAYVEAKNRQDKIAIDISIRISEARGRLERLEEVRRQMSSYLELTNGDQVIARRFLAKRFSEELILSALGPIPAVPVEPQ